MCVCVYTFRYMDDMFAIPLTQIKEALKAVESKGEPIEDYVLVVPRGTGERKYYVVKEKDLNASA